MVPPNHGRYPPSLHMRCTSVCAGPGRTWVGRKKQRSEVWWCVMCVVVCDGVWVWVWVRACEGASITASGGEPVQALGKCDRGEAVCAYSVRHLPAVAQAVAQAVV